MAKKKLKKHKPGPAPMGLGPPFTIRLSERQHHQVSAIAEKQNQSLGEVIRRAIKDAWAIS